MFSGTLATTSAWAIPRSTTRASWPPRAGSAPIGSWRRGPSGLDTKVQERGANFSSGERQLIAFARALCREPEILILDEATASVDPETERVIERGIGELMAGRTSIVIAHRLSTVQRASRIVVIDAGRSPRWAATTSCWPRAASTRGCTGCR